MDRSHLQSHRSPSPASPLGSLPPLRREPAATGSEIEAGIRQRVESGEYANESEVLREALLHALTPEEILGLARVAYGKMPQGLLVTVAGKDFSFVEKLSDEVQAAVPVAVDKALSWLSPYLAR